MIPIERQIAAVERELRFRRQVYPRRVAMQKMSQKQADEEIEVMQAVLGTLQALPKTQGSLI